MGFNFEKLEVYNKAVEFTELIYKITKAFPQEEVYGLISQLRRASISTNIAEGSNRSSRQFRNFLDIARGSVLECIPLINIALKEQYINKSAHKELYSKCETLSKMISALKRSLSKR